MGFNYLSKLGKKAWNLAKSGVTKIHTPLKKITNTLHKGANFVDDLLTKAGKIGVPASVIDVVRNNPLYSTVQSSIELADDLVSKDLPGIGSTLENFVEHDVFNQHPKKSVKQAKELFERARDIGTRTGSIARGFSRNMNPIAGQQLGPGLQAT